MAEESQSKSNDLSFVNALADDIVSEMNTKTKNVKFSKTTGKKQDNQKPPQLNLLGTPTDDYPEFSVSRSTLVLRDELAKLEVNALQRAQSERKIELTEQEKVFEKLRISMECKALTIIVFGASGHLAKTKTFPALFDLFNEGVFPEDVNIVGYARSKLSRKDFHKKISLKLKGDNVSPFLDRCVYFSGKGYDDDESFVRFAKFISEQEDDKYNGEASRLCYLATPPGVFVMLCERIKRFLMPKQALDEHSDKFEEKYDELSSDARKCQSFVRVIIEKPFGKDLQSSNRLASEISKFLREENIYRIDHYLAKEMVQNIIVFRFANVIWDAIWNRKYIRCIKISMKETAALDGRGGYYDEYGVIRDVLQNHLMQVLTLICMEQPVSLRAEDVRDEKVKVLKCVAPMRSDTTVIGQYGASADGKKSGYRDDPSIKNGDNPQSNQITFCQTILYVNNHRWAGIPIICKCGKGLDSKNTEVRIQFKNDGLTLFPDANFNEIVMRLQPNEAIWCKVNTKTPGFARFDKAQPFELDFTYKNRLGPVKMPGAYTRLILDALEGDQSLFVRSDELREAWRIVTPFLHEIVKKNIDPPKYPRGGRGPPEADEMAQRYGFQLIEQIYHWKEYATQQNKL